MKYEARIIFEMFKDVWRVALFQFVKRATNERNLKLCVMYGNSAFGWFKIFTAFYMKFNSHIHKIGITIFLKELSFILYALVYNTINGFGDMTI